MEYSVKDLVKILLKKWYIILLAVCVIGTASFFLSNASFQQAMEDYRYYTSMMEKLEDGAGIAVAEYTIHTDSTVQPEIAEALLQDLEQTAQESRLFSSVQQAVDLHLIKQEATPDDEQEPVVVAGCTQVELVADKTLRVTVQGLSEDLAKMILSGYVAELQQTLSSPIASVELTQTSYQFRFIEPALSDSAELAQLIMQEPVAKPSMVRTVVTSAVFSFALACIAILVITFMKDSAAQNKKDEQVNDPS